MPGAPSPDPVVDPSGYQQHLLGLLGEDDPAEVQAGSVAAWRALVDEAGDRVAERPEPTEWSVLECLAHAADAEWVCGGRYRWIVAHDEPPLIGYDQALWVERLHTGRGESADELLALLAALRAANLAMWGRAGEPDKVRIGMHAERGPESFDLTFRLLAGHDRFHLAQARWALSSLPG
jgi:hypothetical protein